MNNAATKLRTLFIILSLAIGSGLVAPTQAQEATPYEYPDVPRGHWAYEALYHESNRHWLEGYPDGNYHGDKAMRRYEFTRAIAAFGSYHGFTPKFYTHKAIRSRWSGVSVALRLQPIRVVPDPREPDRVEYPDVPRGHWAYEAVRLTTVMAIIEGLPNGTFGGNRDLTRYACAVALARLLNYWGLPPNRDGNAHSKKDEVLVVPSYPDVPETHWAFHAISALNKQGIFEGFADGNFHGSKPMSRYAFAVTLARVLRLGSR